MHRYYIQFSSPVKAKACEEWLEFNHAGSVSNVGREGLRKTRVIFDSKSKDLFRKVVVKFREFVCDYGTERKWGRPLYFEVRDI